MSPSGSGKRILSFSRKNATNNNNPVSEVAPTTKMSLLRLRPNRRFAILRDLDVNHVWGAADRAVFDVFLIGPRRWIDRDYDFLAT